MPSVSLIDFKLPPEDVEKAVRSAWSFPGRAKQAASPASSIPARLITPPLAASVPALSAPGLCPFPSLPPIPFKAVVFNQKGCCLQMAFGSVWRQFWLLWLEGRVLPEARKG